MNETTKKIAGTAGSAMLLVSMGAAATTTLATQDAYADKVDQSSVVEQATSTAIRQAPKTITGHFSFTQGEVNSVDDIRARLGAAPLYLCNAQTAPDNATVANPSEWAITVSGDVENAYTATLGELAEEGSAQLVMGCTYAGNPTDGRASVNADVLGVQLAYIAYLAQPAESVNTIVFTSEDGYEVALPYFYVRSHFSLIAYDVNGEPIANSIGGSNQLWLGSTAASYFSRNVERIEFQTRQTPPPTPGTEEAGDTYANLPNVSIEASL